MIKLGALLPVKQQLAVPDCQGVKLSVWQILWLVSLFVLAASTISDWVKRLSPTLEDNSIQFLTIALLAVAFQRYKKKAEKLEFQRSLVGLAFLVCMSALYVAAGLFGYHKGMYVAFVGILAGALWAYGGRRQLEHWSPLFIFSLFLGSIVPGYILAWSCMFLQLASTKGAVFFAHLFIPITHQGNVFFVKGHPYEVATACSGLSMWTGFIFAICIWHLFMRLSWLKLSLLLVASPIIGVVLNSIRLGITALVGYFVSHQVAHDIHTNLEYILFPMGILALWSIGSISYAKK